MGVAPQGDVATGEDHRHCKVCGRVCPTDKDVCSTPCREKRQAMLQKRRNYVYFFYALIVFLGLLLALNFVRL